jgi:hypothetical protein
MKSAIALILLLTPVLTSAGGLLGDVTVDLGRISKQVDKQSAKQVEAAVGKIERAEIAQTLQAEAFLKRIVELESVVKKQQDLLEQYQRVVAELQAKVGAGK